ncbi:MAG TPA: universal stress protein [Candidatus Methylomirabilis sp.]|nr:universal stress protein [Candidatus Methylomirabilis sp.]
MKPLGRILHPTDFCQASGAAFATAVTLAKESRAELLLFHVIARP